MLLGEQSILPDRTQPSTLTLNLIAQLLSRDSTRRNKQAAQPKRSVAPEHTVGSQYLIFVRGLRIIICNYL